MEVATALIGSLPSLAPRPTGANIRALEQDLIKKLGSIPSHQSRKQGYTGMIMQPVLYARRCNTPWQDFADPGRHRAIDPQLNTAGQADLLVEWTYNKGVYDSEQNLKAAIIMGMNKSVPPEYRRLPNDVGTREFRITDSPLDIMNKLRGVYGQLTPTERMNMENKWGEIWNPSVPIESYFKQVEDIYEQALAHPPAFTEAQMIQKAITSVEQSGLFPTALLEWNGFQPPNNDWANLRSHFGEAYQLLITSGPQGRKLMSGFIGNTQGITDQDGEDDDLTIITNALGEVTLSNNAAAQVVSEQMASLNREMAAMRAAFAANAQGTAPTGVSTTGSLSTMGSPPPISTVYQVPQAPPPAQYPYQAPLPQQGAYAAVPTTPIPPAPRAYYPPAPRAQVPPAAPYGSPPASMPIAGPPPQMQGQYQQPYQGQGWGGRGRGGRGGRGRGGRGRRNRLAYGPQPPGQPNQHGYGNQPQYGTQRIQDGYSGGAPQRTYRKHFNNWNMCFSCGFDVPYWHTSKTCPPECRKAGHQEECDRDNYRSYVQAGHSVRMKKEDARILPTNPGPHQA